MGGGVCDGTDDGGGGGECEVVDETTWLICSSCVCVYDIYV